MASGPGQPGALMSPVLPAVYPPPNSGLPALTPLHPGGYSWRFAAGKAGLAQAHHFAGALQALNPGLRVLIFITGTSPAVTL